MEPKIRRKFKALSVTLSTSTASATTVRWDDVAGGALLLGTGSTSATTIQLWASGSADGPFGRVYNADGSAANITLAMSPTSSTVYAMPDACYGVGAVKLVAGQAEGTAVSATVLLKT